MTFQDYIALHPDLQAAQDLCIEFHAGQTRKDGVTAYHVHPIRVATRLYDAGVRDHNILIAALLHDVLEDCPVTITELRGLIGFQTASIVEELTLPHPGPRGRGKGEKQAYLVGFQYKSQAACLVKVCDRMDNLLDWKGMDPAYKQAYAAEGLLIAGAAGLCSRKGPYKNLLQGLVTELTAVCLAARK